MENIIAQSTDEFFSFSKHSEQHPALIRNSHAAPPMKPKIRVIHIVAPKIIKTDVENFRNLVQRLTGKSAQLKRRGKKVLRVSPNCTKLWTNFDDQHHQGYHDHISQGSRRIKEVQYLCKGSRDGNSSLGSFGGGFGDLVQGRSQFPLQPALKLSQTQFQTMIYGEMPLC